MQKRKNCSHVCVYHCAQLLYTTQHRAVLIIFPLILQTSTRAQMLSTVGDKVRVKTIMYFSINFIYLVDLSLRET